MDLCEELMETVVFHHYAYGDPSPVYARYVGEEGPVKREDDPIIIYVRCQRERLHNGKHLAESGGGYISKEPKCKGCDEVIDQPHTKECPYNHPWPRNKVDHTHTKIAPV